jgi:hypothetical protein
MADNAVLYKLLAKSVGIKYGIMPTFMAKPWANVSARLMKTPEIASREQATDVTWLLPAKAARMFGPYSRLP